MRISDWSSDVCSSDLEIRMTARRLETRPHPDDRIDPGKTGPQVMRHVTVNVAESPIAWLAARSEEHTSELQSLMRSSYAVFRLKTKPPPTTEHTRDHTRLPQDPTSPSDMHPHSQ